MTVERGFASVAALVMARAQKQLVEEFNDADLAINAIAARGGSAILMSSAYSRCELSIAVSLFDD